MSGALGWSVTGGVGGVHARLDDLLLLAGCYADAVGPLGQALLELTAVANDPVLAAAALVDPFGGLRVGTALLHATGARGLAGAALETAALAEGLRSAVAAYRVADGVAAAALPVAGFVVGSDVGLALPVIAPLALAFPRAADRVVARCPDLATLTADGLGAAAWSSTWFLPGPPLPLMRYEDVVRIGSSLAPDTGTPAVREIATPPSAADLVPPRTAGDLLRRVALRTVAGEPPGEVAVTRLAGPDGVDRYVVELPGTDTWALRPGDDPRDLAGNLRLSTGAASTYSAAVAAVLAAAGVPPGAPVLLVGHSQGGMAAYAAAASPAVRSRWKVAGVLTAGSPLARIPVPPGVPVLALENADDVVPGLDGRWPADLRSVTTARFRRQTGSVEGNHGLDTYADAADGLPESPSVAAWRRATAGFLAGGAVISTRRYAVTRSRARRRKPP